MKTLALALLFLALPGQAEEHPAHHVKHNMLLFGEDQVFASHLVYKAPHNFQVVLEVSFPAAVQAKYLAEKAAHPDDLLILLLDSMELAKIQGFETLSGTLLRSDSEGEDHELVSGVTLGKGAFKVLYFGELPLSLEPKKP